MKRYTLLLVVFLTGAAVLMLEVVATRILAPYYGNTIFTVSSVIGVFLAALSVGYYKGGTLADKHPYASWFYGIIALGGVATIVMELLVRLLLPKLSGVFSLIEGPPIVCVLLFFQPGLLLGMLSPYAIKLQQLSLPERGMGTLSGEVFFYSTLGSIFGTLITGFYLIPHYGVSSIVLGVGAGLVLLGGLGLICQRKMNGGVMLLLLGCTACATLFLFSAESDANVLYQRDGIYERVTIYSGEQEGKPARFLRQDFSESGGAYVGSSEHVAAYTKYYELYKLFTPELKRVLVIGGGAYTIPRALIEKLPDVEVDVLEIEPGLHDLAQRYFELPASPRIHNIVEDGRRYLADTDKRYDMIFSDVYFSLYSIPVHFTTREFFDLARTRLNPGGLFLANIIGALSRRTPSLLLSEMKTFRDVFPQSYFFAVDSRRSQEVQNIIFAGHQSDTTLDMAQQSSSEDVFFRELPLRQIDPERFELGPQLTLTDDYSPIEYLTSKIFFQSLAPDRQEASGWRLIDGENARELIAKQLSYGARHMRGPGRPAFLQFLQSELRVYSSDVRRQEWDHLSADGQTDRLTNIFLRLAPDKEPRVLLAAHYDNKRDVERGAQTLPFVPGANDSASGVAVLLEIARYLSTTSTQPPVGVDLLFLDGEEGELDLGKRPWSPLGSAYFAEHIKEFYPQKLPVVGVVLDMVCDKDLELYYENHSAARYDSPVFRFWELGQKRYPGIFHGKVRYELNDDHLALIRAGIPSFLVIDYDYPSWHTVNDTLDKCSAKSLEQVGSVLLNFLYDQR